MKRQEEAKWLALLKGPVGPLFAAVLAEESQEPLIELLVEHASHRGYGDSFSTRVSALQALNLIDFSLFPEELAHRAYKHIGWFSSGRLDGDELKALSNKLYPLYCTHEARKHAARLAAEKEKANEPVRKPNKSRAKSTRRSK